MRSAHDWGCALRRAHWPASARLNLAVMMLLLIVAATPSTATAQSYRIYGVPDTLAVGQPVTVYGLSLNGSGKRCPDCSFATTDPNIADRTSTSVAGWGTTNPGAHETIVAKAPGVTNIYGTIYHTATRFQKRIVVVNRGTLAYIELFCGVARCPSTTSVGGAGNATQIVAYGFDKNGNVLWSEPAPR